MAQTLILVSVLLVVVVKVSPEVVCSNGNNKTSTLETEQHQHQQINHRALLLGHRQLLTELFNLKFFLTIDFCASKQAKEKLESTYQQFQQLTSQIDVLLHNSENLKHAETSGALIEKSIHFISQFVPSESACGKDEQCQKCTEALDNDANSYRMYAQYYRKRLDDLLLAGALNCKLYLVQFCHGPNVQMVTQQAAERNELADALDNLIDRKAIPEASQLQPLVQRAFEMIRYHQSAQVDLCQGEAKCERCLKHNVDCWSSNAEYAQASYLYCKTPVEWQLIGYRAQPIADNCTTLSLH